MLKSFIVVKLMCVLSYTLLSIQISYLGMMACSREGCRKPCHTEPTGEVYANRWVHATEDTNYISKCNLLKKRLS